MDWIEEKLKIGGFPIKVNFTFNPDEFDYIINVSDEFYVNIHNSKTFWFPMNEVTNDMGINSLYGALYIMFIAEKGNKSVYLHCHAGVNRSRTVKQAYYYMMKSKHIDEYYNGYVNLLIYNCYRKHLLNKESMEKFLSLCREKFEQGICGGTLDSIKLEI